MSRWWNEWIAEIDDALGLPWATLLLLAAAGVVAAAWYWFPAWLPWLWWPAARRGLRGITRVRRRQRAAKPDEPTVEPAITPAVEPEPTVDELPDLPATALVSLADEYAAQGRYAEAVRERLRAVVRELVDSGAIQNRPGWTVTELARAAGTARPTVRPPLDAASLLFSEIWYGQRPAGPAQDARMREHAAQVHAALGAVPVGSPR